MKFITFCEETKELSYGLLFGPALDRVLVLPNAMAWHESTAGRASAPHVVAARFGADLVALIERQDVAMPVARELLARSEVGDIPPDFDGFPLTLPLAAVTLAAPIPSPRSVRDGYAFRQHVETARRNRGVPMIPEFNQFPVFYFTNHRAVIGPGVLPVMPLHLERLDFELECAVVIGRPGRNVKAEEADALVFGYTVMNDFSARALQMDEMKLNLGPAKGKDFATAIGPWLVTPDELEDAAQRSRTGLRHDLRMRAWVNGAQVSEGNLRDMTWTFAQIIERASYGVELVPGEVIGSGTCGTGCFLELNGSGVTQDQWLCLGDRVELEIDRMGRLAHVVVAHPDVPPSIR